MNVIRRVVKVRFRVAPAYNAAGDRASKLDAETAVSDGAKRMILHQNASRSAADPTRGDPAGGNGGWQAVLVAQPPAQTQFEGGH
jgi:hypothetical protein